MAKTKTAESGRDSFEPLYERYLSILCNLQLLVLALDMQMVPNVIHPAIRVLGETTKEAEQFFEDLQIWAADHKEVQS